MNLVERLGLFERDLVAIVGGGGKSSLLLGLGSELLAVGSSVVLTTTTKMSTDQIPSWAGVIRTPVDVGSSGASFLVGEIDGGKVTGVAPEVVDDLFSGGKVDFVLVEADGARRRSFKAPAAHEPVIPSAATLVAIVAGMAAVGGRIGDVTHRPERVAVVAGRSVEDLLTPGDVAAVVGSPEGGLKGVPDAARVVVVLTAGGAEHHRRAATDVAGLLGDHPRIGRVVVLTDEDRT